MAAEIGLAASSKGRHWSRALHRRLLRKNGKSGCIGYGHGFSEAKEVKEGGDEVVEIEKRVKVLQSLVPGGEAMEMESLFEETADYIEALKEQAHYKERTKRKILASAVRADESNLNAQVQAVQERAAIDSSTQVRKAQLAQYNYILVVGEEETNTGQWSLLEKFCSSASNLNLKPRKKEIFIEALARYKERTKTKILASAVRVDESNLNAQVRAVQERAAFDSSTQSSDSKFSSNRFCWRVSKASLRKFSRYGARTGH
ncbi:hypothetical protein J5N97_004285 [Dioscorea zingiberensis]|uniref:Uncharacterized protein n=1 Tax=Dioscorea zingiberensis TaxID=325984 RepID=A0A9D5D7L3_9LILI|nr:hypothetical protein J5N97_004285 [Dioscorea zingiberensis]